MIGMSSNKLADQLSTMPDQALPRMAQQYKDDAITLSMILSEKNRRDRVRQTGAAQQAQQPQAKVNEQVVASMQPLPEDVGIGALPAPNMQGMAEGGIVGFADGGQVAFAKGGKPSADAFEQAFQTVLRLEGGAKYVADDAGKGPTKYGINKTANPDVDVKNLTEAQARKIYRERYWDKINGDALAAKDPALATIAFDAAVNQGAGTANKMVAAAGGDPTKLLEMRKQRYDALVQAKPEEYGRFSKGWDTRLASLATAALPMGAAQAAPGKTGIASVAPADDAASRIPGSSVRAPAAAPDTSGYMARKATEMGIPEDVQRNISNLATAAGGAMGAGYIPSYLPKVGGGLAALGERAYEIISPSKQMTPAQIEALRVANQGSRVAEAARAAEMTGALPGEALSAAQAVEAANAAKLAAMPSKAEQVQTAAALRQAEEANRLAAAAKTVQYGGQAAAGSATADVAAQPAATEGGIPDLAMGSKEDFRRRELRDQAKAESPIQAQDSAAETAAAAGEKPSWLTNDRALLMGLNLLAGSGKPGSGSAIRDLLGGLGTAGLSTLASERSDRAAKAAETYQTSMGKKAEAEAAYITRGGKEKNEITLAEDLAQKRMKDWLGSSAGKLAGLDQAAQDAMLNRFRLDAYNQYGISMKPTTTAAVPTGRQAWGAATVS